MTTTPTLPSEARAALARLDRLNKIGALGAEEAADVRTLLALVACPSWCERTDHDADLVDADNPPRHFGPDWGIFDAQADGDAEPEVTIHEPITFKGSDCAAGLRKVAADALAAAAWLEAVR